LPLQDSRVIYLVAVVLLALSGVLFWIERYCSSRNIRTTLELSFKGDVKRETAFLAQYGQAVATPIAAWLVWCSDPPDWTIPLKIIIPVLVTSIIATTIKKLTGRVRPRHPQAGQFLGPSFKHANHRESFPSSHSACAMALSVALIPWYPQAMVVFWVLAIATAVIRYLLDAHFPSDVLAGSALGLAVGTATVQIMARSIPAL